MVTEAEVEQAYKFLMGRKPENREVVLELAKANATVEELRRTFITSLEFREMMRLPPPDPDALGYKPLIWPKTPVEVDVSQELLNRMFDRIEFEFRRLGTTEPYWSVITSEEYLKRNIKGQEQKFFELGRGVVDDLFVAADRYDVDVSSLNTCLELGCGVGRSTVWLAERFRRVIATDISRSHLDIARNELRERGKENVQLMHFQSLQQLDRIPAFDVFFSIIVLQHNPPPIMRHMLAVILNKLAPGGVAYFQIPTYGVNYRFAADAYINEALPLHNPEMHVLPQPTLFDVIAASNCSVLEFREDGASGPRFISNRVLIRKPAERADQKISRRHVVER